MHFIVYNINWDASPEVINLKNDNLEILTTSHMQMDIVTETERLTQGGNAKVLTQNKWAMIQGLK